MKRIFFLLSLILFSCNQNKRSSNQNAITVESHSGIGDTVLSPAEAFAQSIQNAHNKEDWDKENVVSFKINLKMGGAERLNAHIFSSTNSSKIRIDKKDGSSLYYDGSRVYQSPADAPIESARFDMFTWQYFFAFPFKLRDEGTNWELLEDDTINGITFNRARLTFDNNIGDAPDDWYVVYKEPKSEMLYAAAYIVTLNEEKEKAEEKPHAIVYHNYELFNGIPFATRWTFHNWSLNNGIEDQIGEAIISDIQFITPKKKLFEIPDDAKKIELN
ncbi:MAG TPA: hypothetical protein VK941_08215 [Gillisia sp.]|nr:hypothetical protein [Gillisia sp.]